MAEGKQRIIRVLKSIGLPGIVASAYGVMLSVLLHRSMFHGGAQSFDAMLYVRSLWGVAHADFFNPVLQQHVFSIHGHFLLFLIAPFVHLWPASYVLIGAQALALTSVVFILLRALERTHSVRMEQPIALVMLRTVAFSLLFTLGTPLVLNPFFFDLHPGLLGVPFLTAALLRRAEFGFYDARSIAMMCVAVLGREDFALAAAAGILVAPYTDRRDFSVGAKSLIAGGFVLYFAGYWLCARGVSVDVARQLLGNHSESFEVSMDGIVWMKMKIATLLLVSAGLWTIWGWRMLGSVIPGFVFLMANQWLVDGQLRYQYSMLVAPGLIAAGVSGYQRVRTLSLLRKSIVFGGAPVLAGLSFYFAGAAPGGGQFRPAAFTMKDESGALSMNLSYRDERVENAYALLAQIPRDVGLAVPYQFGVAVADRPVIWPLFKLAERLKNGAPIPEEIDSVVIFAGDYATAGVYLITREKFRLVARSGPLLQFSRVR